MQFNVIISSDSSVSPDYAQLTSSEKQEVIDTMNAAAAIWSWYLPSSITLDLSIQIDNSAYSGNTVADGGANGYYNTGTTFQGTKVYDAITDIKLKTGVDSNGSNYDLGMKLTVDSIRNRLYFLPNPAATVGPYTVPSDRTDALSVFLHEVGHGLGIGSLSSAITDTSFNLFKSTYDTFIDGNGRFIGSHALDAVSGAPIQLEPTSISHLSESGPFGSDLMSTILPSGTQARISALDVAMLQDIGVPIRAATAADDVLHAISNTPLSLGDGNDTVYVDYHSVSIDGGNGVDTAIFSGNKASYTVTQTSTGNFTISGPDGTDSLTKIEYAQFSDQRVRLYPGTGTAVDFSAPPPSYMTPIRDFDGNDLGGAQGWQLLGTTDVNHSGNVSHVYVNSAIGRWAEVGTAPDGLVYFSDYNWAGATRVVGIYIDPLVQSGVVAAGSAIDSQRRFQNDLQISNIAGILGSGDYDGDGYQEIYFRLTDGTAYLHAYMWDDGNIRYANYQNTQQVKDYLTSHGYGASTWGSWFPASDTLATGPMAAVSISSDSLNQNGPGILAGIAV